VIVEWGEGGLWGFGDLLNDIIALAIALLPWLAIVGTQIALLAQVGVDDTVATVMRLGAPDGASRGAKAGVAILLA
jgi:hypothetical protein